MSKQTRFSLSLEVLQVEICAAVLREGLTIQLRPHRYLAYLSVLGARI